MGQPLKPVLQDGVIDDVVAEGEDGADQEVEHYHLVVVSSLQRPCSGEDEATVTCEMKQAGDGRWASVLVMGSTLLDFT
jgi:hypothetical protein